jgi:hypothetical protein
MNRFTSILKKINEQLDLPQPQKSRVILEIAADLEDLYNLYIDRGLDENEAARKAVEKFDVEKEALNELISIHQSPFQKFFYGLSGQVQIWWERAALVIILIIILATTLTATLTSNFVQQSSKFVWPLIGIFVVILVLSVSKIYTLYIKKDHSLEKARAGLPLILFLILLNFAFGTLGYYIELFSSGSEQYFVGLIAVLATEYSELHTTTTSVAQYHLRYASVMLVNISITVFTSVFWFLLHNKIHKIEQEEAVWLLKS